MDLVGFGILLMFGLMGSLGALVGLVLWLVYLKKGNPSRSVRYLGSVAVLCLLCLITFVTCYPITKWILEDDLTSAAMKGDTETVEFTLRMGTDVNIKEENSDFTPLMFAASNGNTDTVKALLRHHADVNYYSARGFNGERATALGLAIVHHHPDIARLLQDVGAQ